MPMPRRIKTRGPVSPLAIALSTLGTGMAQYGRDREERTVRAEEIGRLNEAEGYRRKMAKDALKRAEQQRVEERNAKTKELANRRRALGSVQPEQLGRPLTAAESEAIVAGDVNPSDLFPLRPSAATTPRPATAGQIMSEEEKRRKGAAFLSQNLNNPVFAEALKVINQQNPAMARDPGLAAYAAMEAYQKQTTTEAAEGRENRAANAGRRVLRPATPGTIPGTPGIPAPVTMQTTREQRIRDLLSSLPSARDSTRRP